MSGEDKKKLPPAVLGKKAGMKRVYDGDKELACTMVDIPDNYVVSLRTNEKDGYAASVIAVSGRKRSRPLLGAVGKTPLRGVGKIKEIKGEFDCSPGERLNAGKIFTRGEKVSVTGISKGKGFASARKRWGFKGGPKTHGQKDKYHSPGSIGASSWPSRVIPGMKMAGRKGGNNVTVRNLKVAGFEGANRMLIAGAVPGAKGTLLVIKKVLSNGR